jgi:hypothetical protein
MGAAFQEVSNPFVDSHGVALGSSTCSASYNFTWNGQLGTFSILSSQHAEGGTPYGSHTASSGFIWLTPSVDLLFDLEGAFDYNLPADFMMATLAFSIADHVDNEEIFGGGDSAETFPGQPSSGTLLLEGSVVIPAGHTSELYYVMMLDTFSGTQGYMATGEGGLTFSLTAVPEPAALLLLAPALLAASSRRLDKAADRRRFPCRAAGPAKPPPVRPAPAAPERESPAPPSAAAWPQAPARLEYP